MQCMHCVFLVLRCLDANIKHWINLTGLAIKRMNESNTVKLNKYLLDLLLQSKQVKVHVQWVLITSLQPGHRSLCIGTLHLSHTLLRYFTQEISKLVFVAFFFFDNMRLLLNSRQLASYRFCGTLSNGFRQQNRLIQCSAHNFYFTNS